MGMGVGVGMRGRTFCGHTPFVEEFLSLVVAVRSLLLLLFACRRTSFNDVAAVYLGLNSRISATTMALGSWMHLVHLHLLLLVSLGFVLLFLISASIVYSFLKGSPGARKFSPEEVEKKEQQSCSVLGKSHFKFYHFVNS